MPKLGAWAKRMIRARLPPRAEVEFSALGVHNRPLIFPRERVVVSWSPKSACTYVVAWFLQQQGLLAAATYYDPWPHNFRQRVYYQSKTYRDAGAAVQASGGEGYTLLRVTREIEPRLVSIFRHTLRHESLREPIAHRLGGGVGHEALSLREFDRFLEGQDLSPRGPADIHFRIQSHPCWEMAWDRVVTLNIDTHPLEAGLAAIEADLGLGGKGIDAHPERLRRLASPGRYASGGAYEGREPIEAHRFAASKAKAFPKEALLASPFLRGMAHRHYRADLGRVATGDTEERLFAELPARAPGAARREVSR